MNCSRKFLTVVCIASLSHGFAQNSEVSIIDPRPLPKIGPLLRPFHLEKRQVSPARLTNTPRLESLVRAGQLYLSVQDVIALSLENNLDIAIQRYGPFLAREVLRRAEGGAILRSIDQSVIPGPVSVSLAGVSINASGLAGGAGVGAIGTIVTQAGPAPPILDPSLFAYANFVHNTIPLSNTVLSQTTALIQDSQQYQFGYNQQFITGTNISATYSSSKAKVNSPANLLNPATQAYIDFTINQPLLQGFSKAVNNRDIRVARNNTKFTNLQLKRQVITTVSAVVNLYWDLVSFNEDLRIKEQALAGAEKLYNDNKEMVRVGTLASIEVTRAAAEVSASKESLLISQTNVAQQETVLKNALSRNGVQSPWLDEVHVVALDRIEVPDTENLKPTAQLIEEALSKRAEVEQTKVNFDSQQIMLKGTKNSLLPSLSAFAEFTNNALSGPVNPLYNGGSGAPDPYFVGGYGNLLGQIFRRNFPNYSAGFSLNIPFRNRAAQADYVTDQLQLRQSELQLQRTLNQVRVDVKNAVVGLQQARARYETAVATRKLAMETLDAEQKRFKFGDSTNALVIQAQKDLATAQSAEVQATANYTHARIAFEDAVGITLEVNHISMEEAVSGHVSRPSSIPDQLPAVKK